jgi:hypothetical protein
MPSPLGRRGEYFSASVRCNFPMWSFGRIRLLTSRKLASTFHLISTSSARASRGAVLFLVPARRTRCSRAAYARRHSA